MKRPLVVEEERINFDVRPGGKKGHSGKQGGKGGSTSQLGPSMLAKKEKAAQKQQKAKGQGQEPAGEKMTDELKASQDLSQEASQAAGETAAAGAEKSHKRRRRRRKPKEQKAEGQFQEETDLP